MCTVGRIVSGEDRAHFIRVLFCLYCRFPYHATTWYHLPYTASTISNCLVTAPGSTSLPCQFASPHSRPCPTGSPRPRPDSWFATLSHIKLHPLQVGSSCLGRTKARITVPPLRLKVSDHGSGRRATVRHHVRSQRPDLRASTSVDSGHYFHLAGERSHVREIQSGDVWSCCTHCSFCSIGEPEP